MPTKATSDRGGRDAPRPDDGAPAFAGPSDEASRLVSVSQMEISLDRVRDSVANPCHGIHGPGTVSWEISRENVLFLGGGRAALLQIAHPYVAAAIETHSRTFEDATGRFRRTFENVWAMTFGDLGQALEAARRVHRIHSSIRGRLPDSVGLYPKGHAYHANQAGALLWVYATLVDTSVQVFELIVRPLSHGEKERFLAESRNFAFLFGIPEGLLPPRWEEFQDYIRRMLVSGAIVAEGAAVRIARTLLHPPGLWLSPAAAWYRTVTAWLLPQSLREPFGLPLGRGGAMGARFSAALLRPVRRVLPPLLRYVPPYRSALRRVRAESPPRKSPTPSP